MTPSRADLIESAKRLLRGENASPAQLLLLARQLNGQRAFDMARRLLAKARELCGEEFAIHLEIEQQWALCTYKDPDLPVAARLEQAFTILAGALQSAEEATCAPARTPAAARVAQETFGIAGAIWKQQWRVDGRDEHLEKSLEYYRKGYDLGPQHDNGYTGVNAAFVLDLLDRRDEATAIREHVVEVLSAAESPPRDWWTLVTLAEALFGLRRYEEAGTWLQQAAAFEETNRGKPQGVQPWEYETTVKQLADLARRSESQGAAEADLDSSPAWKVLVDFVGPARAAGVRTAFAGKVGLALSGGGFRASLFHIGVLARLAELDMLRNVEVLSCVSGGSIIGAHYYLEVRKLLERKLDQEITREDYIALVRDLERDFLAIVQTNPRMKAFTTPRILLSVSRRHSRTTRLGEVLERDLYARAAGAGAGESVSLSGLFVRPHGEVGFTLKYDNWRRLTKVPILLLNATTLNTGHNWQFAASWMGESPARLDTEIDGNKRLRRMYYDDAPQAYRNFSLGMAVAASACVPGLFPPVALEGLYPDHVVRLVDGGVHDNQGINGLLEQDCTVILVSDASGQMATLDRPQQLFPRVLGRSNTILMARVREAQHKELQMLKRASLLRGLMFLHLKKDLAIESVDWVDCNDPKERESEGGVPIRAINLTSYGVRADVQNLLANIRTDLDAFSEAEAFALMASGYRMAEREFGRCVPSYAAAGDVRADWRFLAVEPMMSQPAGSRRFVQSLEIGACRLWKAARFRPWWRTQSLVVAFLLVDWLAAIIVTFGWPGFLAILALATVGFLAGLAYRLSRRIDGLYLRAGSLVRVRAEQPRSLPRTRARLVRVDRPAELSFALQQLGIITGKRSAFARRRPVLVLIGGAAGLADTDADVVAAFFAHAVVPLAKELGAAVIDGGSDSGVARLMGQARAAARARFPLVGVAAAGTVSFPENTAANPEAAPLERRHSHFIIVPGHEWGDECPWLAQTASALADGAPTITMLVNGGPISLRDATESLRLERPIVAMRGTGGLADRLAALHARQSAAGDESPAMTAIVSSRYFHVLDVRTPASDLRGQLRMLLRGARPASITALPATPAPSEEERPRGEGTSPESVIAAS